MLNLVRLGYRHIDTAAEYQIEDEVGAALAAAMRDGSVRREGELKCGRLLFVEGSIFPQSATAKWPGAGALCIAAGGHHLPGWALCTAHSRGR